MKVSGFTFIRNALTYDYPIVEAIKSILPICDEMVVAVGNSSDDTLGLIRSINDPKIRIIETVWDDTKREGGEVLALETDKAFQALMADSTWAFYIQGDEVVHEQYLPAIREAMERYKYDYNVEGLLFKYLHFYGSYDYVGSNSHWYKHEIRIVRSKLPIKSYKDAQGFRIDDNRKLNVKRIDAYMYHYGWVKEPQAMQRKQLNFNKYWHDDQWISQNVAQADSFDYSQIDQLQLFEGSHPQVMLSRIAAKNWKYEHDLSKNKIRWKDRIKNWVFRYLGIELGYKNYRVV